MFQHSEVKLFFKTQNPLLKPNQNLSVPPGRSTGSTSNPLVAIFVLDAFFPEPRLKSLLCWCFQTPDVLAWLPKPQLRLTKECAQSIVDSLVFCFWLNQFKVHLMNRLQSNMFLAFGSQLQIDLSIVESR